MCVTFACVCICAVHTWDLNVGVRYCPLYLMFCLTLPLELEHSASPFSPFLGDVPPHLASYVGSKDLNLGPHVCIAKYFIC